MSDSLPKNIHSDSSLSRERDYSSSSSSSRGKLLTPLGSGVEGEKEGRNQIPLSLSESIQRYYGISHLATQSINELKLLNRHKNIIAEFEIQKAFTYSGICFILGRDEKDKTVKKLLRLLVSRKLLFIYAWKGTAKRTFGVKIYYTPDATQADLSRILYEYEIEDALRKSQEDRGAKKKTPEEVVEHNLQVKQLTEQRRKELEEERKKSEQERKMKKLKQHIKKIYQGGRKHNFHRCTVCRLHPPEVVLRIWQQEAEP